MSRRCSPRPPCRLSCSACGRSESEHGPVATAQHERQTADERHRAEPASQHTQRPFVRIGHSASGTVPVTAFASLSKRARRSDALRSLVVERPRHSTTCADCSIRSAYGDELVDLPPRLGSRNIAFSLRWHGLDLCRMLALVSAPWEPRCGCWQYA